MRTPAERQALFPTYVFSASHFKSKSHTFRASSYYLNARFMPTKHTVIIYLFLLNIDTSLDWIILIGNNDGLGGSGVDQGHPFNVASM